MKRHFRLIALSLTFLALAIGGGSPSASRAGSAKKKARPRKTHRAVCVLRPVGDSGVTGTIHFVRKRGGVEITGLVTGLAAGKHGFHVHQSGDLTDPATGKSAGGHFNPDDMPHGKPSDEKRHVGDLGNIEANADGKAVVKKWDSVISLHGPHSIVARAIVVHAGEDVFTQPTGDAGARIAFGVIGLAGPAKGK